MTPSERTRALYVRRGYKVGMVERFISPGGRGGYRKDLFGCIDFIAMKDDQLVGVQSTGTDFKGHFDKITVECSELAQQWLRSGAELHLIGWRRLKAGMAPREHVFTLADFEDHSVISIQTPIARSEF